MHWTRAAETASQIAAGWTSEGGPGGASLLFDDNDLRAEACGGLASIEHGLPFTPDTVTRYASISKQFLAALLLKGRAIELNDTLGTHLPTLRPALGRVSVGHALDMTGGLPDVMETLWLLGVPITAALRRDALLSFVTSLDALNSSPGTELSYSNTGYRLIETALEAKGADYGTALREHFFAPLGLSIRLADDWQTPVPDLAAGYWRGPHGWQRGSYGMHFSASGGLAGSARDLAIWAQALLADRAPADGLLGRLSAPRHMADGRESGYGLGLAWSRVGGRTLVGHGGSLPGYKNHFLLDPEARAGAVVLTNREDADAHGIALSIMAALHNEALPAPAPANALPEGIFASETGPFWLRLAGGRAMFLGAEEALYAQADGWFTSRSAILPMRLHMTEDGAIEGEIGHAARRFRSVAADTAADRGWSGEWRSPEHGAHFAIAEGAMTCGIGPLSETLRLQPLGSGRALFERWAGPWRQVACLCFANDEVRLVSNRSRVLQFRRG